MAPLVAQDKASFDTGLEEVHKYMEQGRWDKAEDSLNELTLQHARADYVLTQRELLMEDARRIAFWQTVTPPPLEDLVHGELKSWKPGTKSKIDLIYSTDAGFADFESSKYALYHPLVFTGSYEVEIEGKSYPWGDPPYLLLCIDGETSYLASIGIPPDGKGTYYPARLYRRVGDEEEKLDELDSVPVKTGGPFVIQVKVTEAKITVKINKKEILSAKRNRDDAMGQLAIGRAMFANGIESVRISGQVNSSWAGNLIDAALQEERAAFESSFEPKKHLPSWLVDAEVTSVDSIALRAYPAPHSSRPHKAWSQVPLGIQRGKADEALEWLLELDEDEIAATHRAFLACLLHQELGNAEAALQACREVLEGDRYFLPSRLTEA
jgi:tetratricopeptide (TPR) repeat protein